MTLPAPSPIALASAVLRDAPATRRHLVQTQAEIALRFGVKPKRLVRTNVHDGLAAAIFANGGV